MKISKEGHKYKIIKRNEPIHIDKHINAQYWDSIDSKTEEFIKTMLEFGGIQLCDMGDYGLVREIQEKVMCLLEEAIPETNFPTVDEEL